MLSPVTDLMLCYVRRKGLYIDTAHVGGVAAFGKTLTPLNWGTPDRSEKKKKEKKRKKERKKENEKDRFRKERFKKERKKSKQERDAVEFLHLSKSKRSCFSKLLCFTLYIIQRWTPSDKEFPPCMHEERIVYR